MTATGFFAPVTHQDLIDKFAAGAKHNFRIVFPTESNYSGTPQTALDFNALIKSINQSVQVGEAVGLEFTLRVSGALTWNNTYTPV